MMIARSIPTAILLALSLAWACSSTDDPTTPTGVADGDGEPGDSTVPGAGGDGMDGAGDGDPTVPSDGTGDDPSQPSVPGDGEPTPADDPTGSAGSGGLDDMLPGGDCQGFEVEGLQYSPGGTVLPNTCEPFDPVTNNPYAIRCVDAMPGYETPFPGDELCVLPPEPDKGFQVGLHPQGDQYWDQMWAGDLSGYQDPDPIWILPAGDEVTQNYRVHSGVEEDRNYYRIYFRMRSGSHHNIITLHDSGAEGWIGSRDVAALPGLFGTPGLVGVIGGQQRPDDQIPSSFEKPPEDEGLYQVFPADSRLLFNMHHFNTTGGPILREGWVNIWDEGDAQTRIRWYMGLDFTQVALLNVGAGETADMHYVSQATGPVRILRLFGHRHAWTSNFSSWIERANGDQEILYQSFDWFDMPTYRYDSVAQNPEPNFDARADGAESGVVELEAGDELHFNCHIEFTDERAERVDSPQSPASIGRIGFANEVYTGEMCIQFGTMVGGLGRPGASTEPVPDFAH